jgi:hypothetical protein
MVIWYALIVTPLLNENGLSASLALIVNHDKMKENSIAFIVPFLELVSIRNWFKE